MGLRAKFNLAMLAAFAVCLTLSAFLSNRLLQDAAGRQALDEANMLMAAASAVRDYTSREIVPLLADQMKTRFLPHSVPSWAAQTNLRTLTKVFPDYSYKEAALNPTNPADRAVEWEADLIKAFQRDGTQSESVTARDTANGPVIAVARPFRLTDKACLTCHSVPSAAPVSMVELYGKDNGFDWKLGDVIGARIVSVPLKAGLERASTLFYLINGIVAGGFLLILVAVNVLLGITVIKPLDAVAARANLIGIGNKDVPEFDLKGPAEIQSLAESLNKMRAALSRTK